MSVIPRNPDYTPISGQWVAGNTARAELGELARVALVHDYLTQYGGAERVLDVLHERFPDAPVFTSLLDLTALPPHYRQWDIQESFLGKVPWASQNHRLLLPLYPTAFRWFARALEPFDLIIADSSAWSHHVRVRPDAVLICYCHSPARFLYGDPDYLAPARIPAPVRLVTGPLFAWLRRGDAQAARRVDRYIANSCNVRQRILQAYGREATVIYPPVDTSRLAPARIEPPEDWYLVVSRLVPHKRVDVAIDAFNVLKLPLKIIGTGRAMEDLRRRAGPTIEFVGALDDAAVIEHLRRCRALILPGAEDFGLTAIEAQAAGRPVIAYGAGGALESIIPGETGLHFSRPTASCLADTVMEFAQRRWDPERAMANAARFSKQRFLQELDKEIERALSDRHRKPERSQTAAEG